MLYDYSNSINLYCYAFTKQNILVYNLNTMWEIGIICKHKILHKTLSIKLIPNNLIVYIYLPGSDSYGNIDSADSTVQSHRTATSNQVN
jgi:hypothetical protein